MKLTTDPQHAEGSKHMNAIQNQKADPFIIIRGGLVQNNPALPVIDLDLLEQDHPYAEDVPEAIEAIRQLSTADRARFADDIDELVGFVENIGQPHQIDTARQVAGRNP